MSSFNYYWETLWELYHIAKDPAEAHNLAGQHPEKLAEFDVGDQFRRCWGAA